MTSFPDEETGREKDPQPTLPPFNDPAFSARPPDPLVGRDAPDYPPPPEDTEFTGHPDFSARAAENRPPRDGMGLTKRVDELDGKTGSRKERFG